MLLKKIEGVSLIVGMLAEPVWAQSSASEPKLEVLWPDGAPGAVGQEDQDQPTLQIYLPLASKATGAAIVVCPGGGYGALALDGPRRPPDCRMAEFSGCRCLCIEVSAWAALSSSRPSARCAEGYSAGSHEVKRLQHCA